MDWISDIPPMVEIFKKAGFSGFATTDPAKARAKHREWDTPPIQCNHKGEHRRVHPQVCEWHLAENDSFCLGECENPWVEKNLKGGRA